MPVRGAGADAASTAPIRNVVLVHGVLVEGSGWRGVDDVLVRDGAHVRMVQKPLTGVAATRCALSQLNGPCVRVGHSDGGSIITGTGDDPNVAALVFVAAHPPDVGENEAALERGMPSGASRKPGAFRVFPDGDVAPQPTAFRAEFAPDPLHADADFQASAQLPTIRIRNASVAGVRTAT